MATKRKYELRQRADDMAETRRRITAAAVHLHGTVGPARTTVSAIARRAGVQRHTVYRHFRTDAELFQACSAQFTATYPPPDLELWRTIEDPRERLERVLDELYAWYERTEFMFSKVFRDIELVPAIGPVLALRQRYLEGAAEILKAGWPARGRRRDVLAVAVRHAVDFQMWRSLVADGRLSRREAIELVGALVDAAAVPDRSRTAEPAARRILSGQR